MEYLSELLRAVTPELRANITLGAINYISYEELREGHCRRCLTEEEYLYDTIWADQYYSKIKHINAPILYWMRCYEHDPKMRSLLQDLYNLGARNLYTKRTHLYKYLSKLVHKARENGITRLRKTIRHPYTPNILINYISIKDPTFANYNINDASWSLKVRAYYHNYPQRLNDLMDVMSKDVYYYISKYLSREELTQMLLTKDNFCKVSLTYLICFNRHLSLQEKIKLLKIINKTE